MMLMRKWPIFMKKYEKKEGEMARWRDGERARGREGGMAKMRNGNKERSDAVPQSWKGENNNWSLMESIIK